LAKLEARNPKSETIEFVAPNLLKYNGVCDGKDYKLELELFDDIDVEVPPSPNNSEQKIRILDIRDVDSS
jgi:hypothetical protein